MRHHDNIHLETKKQSAHCSLEQNHEHELVISQLCFAIKTFPKTRVISFSSEPETEDVCVVIKVKFAETNTGTQNTHETGQR